MPSEKQTKILKEKKHYIVLITDTENALPPDVFCPIYMGKQPPCGGGIMALNGKDGTVIWTSWLQHTVFSLQCAVDLNGDKIPDCLLTGKDGILSTLNSVNGQILWNYHDSYVAESPYLNIYSATFIFDVNNDTIPDILAGHSEENGKFISMQ